jgi:hypothetical protein
VQLSLKGSYCLERFFVGGVSSQHCLVKAECGGQFTAFLDHGPKAKVGICVARIMRQHLLE